MRSSPVITCTAPSPKGATSLHSLSHFIVLSWQLMLSLVSSRGRLLDFNSALLLVAQGFRARRLLVDPTLLVNRKNTSPTMIIISKEK
mmetsp:Transcript_85154/g.170386  ORF Transcript_85154/g.170386 Transcript_85154/m.170386 type:complete len:88 (+) Transcript_85154:266-529(+)